MKAFKIYLTSSKLILGAILLLVSTAASAQFDVEVKASTTVFLKGNTTVSFRGNNWVSASDIQGTAPVIFNKGTAQNVNMKDKSLSGITINNSGGVIMLDSMEVANRTTFSTGDLTIGSFTLRQNGKVEGQGSTGRFKGNGNSVLAFNGGGGNDSFFMDQTTPNTTNRLKDLRVNRSGATIVCGDTAQVRGVVYHLDGTINANNSHLKLKALSPSEYGQVSGVGSGTITGTMCMEMSVGSSVGSPLEQWRHFTSPLKDATLSDELNDDITLQYTPISNANVWTFDQSRLVNTWRPVQADEDMHNNDYAIYLWPLSYGFNPVAASFMVDINGTYPGTGDYHRTLARTNPNGYTGQAVDDTVGWHMVANPYPSNISFPYNANLDGGSSYYVWDITGIWDDSSGCGGCKKRGVYSIYRADNGLTSNSGRSVLPPFHVFYVRASSNGVNLPVSNSWRTTDSMHNFIGRKSNSIFDKLHVKVTSPEKVSDELYLWFDQVRGDNKLDAMDTYKKYNDPFAPNIYTLTDDGKMAAFNVLKEIPKDEDVYSVEMPFESRLPGKFTMDLSFENSYQVSELVLEDRLTDTKHDVLRGGVYEFNNDTASGTFMKDRFVLHFQKRSSTTSIDDYLKENNPIKISTDTKDIFVRFPSVQEGAVIDVYDMLGRSVMKSQTVEVATKQYVINGAGLSSGYYTIRVQNDNGVISAPVFLNTNQ
jgi:hypothetical protein